MALFLKPTDLGSGKLKDDYEASTSDARPIGPDNGSGLRPKIYRGPRSGFPQLPNTNFTSDMQPSGEVQPCQLRKRKASS